MKLKQSLKNFLKVFVVFAIIFNLLYLAKINFSVNHIKSNLKETEQITNELKVLKGDLFIDQKNEESQENLLSSLISKIEQYDLSQTTENSKQEIIAFIQNHSDLSLPEEYYTSKNSINSFSVLNPTDQSLITVSYDNLSEILTLESYLKTDTYTPYQFQAFQDDLQPLLKQESLTQQTKLHNNYQSFLQLNQSILEDPRFLTLQEKSLEQIPAFHSSQTAYLNFLKQGERMLSIQSDLVTDTYKLFDQSNQLITTSQDQDSIIDSLYSSIESKQFPTILEKNIQPKITFIENILNNTDFLKTLQDKNFSISETTNSNNEYSVSVLDQSDQIILTLNIDKQTAQTFLTFQNETEQLNFKDLGFELPEIQKETENHLILGKHGSLTDTIIIANFNNQTKQVKLISLPRDLYLENKKINSIYAYRGLEALVDEVESISGLNIDKYALIDMYTFIDVVDKLGGIEVELTKPLIDPSYTTFDDNQWGTLNLSAGKHQVNGRQALRIARSRHSTSDFDRAYRQHLILSGFQNRIHELGIKDTKTITEIGLLGLESTETNLNFQDTLKYYSRYKDYEVQDSVVLSTANILESTYTGALNSTPNATEEAKNRGAYILLHKNNDWSLIKTFIYSFLSR